MNPTTLEFAPDLSGELTGSVRRAWYPYWKEAVCESRRMLRAPAFAGPFLSLPVLLYLLFGVLLFGAATKSDPKAQMFLFLGFVTFGVMGPGLFGFGVAIAAEREHGLLRLKRALPVPPFATLLARMLMAMLFVAIIMVTMIVGGSIGPVRFTAAQWLGMSAVNIFGAVPFCAMGLFIGTLGTAKSAPALVNLLYLPMIYLSGFLIPLPASVQWIAVASPAFHLHQLTLAAIGGAAQGSPLVHAAVLAWLTVVLTWLAVRRLARVG